MIPASMRDVVFCLLLHCGHCADAWRLGSMIWKYVCQRNVVLKWCCSQDVERGGEGARQEEEDPQDSGFITKMFEKVATTALGPSSLPTKVTPQHFQVQYPALLTICLSMCLFCQLL